MDIVFHPGTNGSDPYVEFYPYTPSASAGYAFTALFGLVTIAHIVAAIILRAGYFVPLILGGICEAFGYYGRAWSHHSRIDIRPWALQEMLILCAPPLISATVYMLLGRVVTAFEAEHVSPMRPKMMTILFVLNDILCFCTQLGGAGVQVTGDASIMNIGRKVVLGGLIFSLVVFGWFVGVAGVFHYRCVRETGGLVVVERMGGSWWERYFVAVYVVCGAIGLRNLVRTIQFGAGRGAAVNQKEIFIYLFDAVLMLGAMGVLLVYHPGRLIRAVRRVGKAEDFNQALTESRGGEVLLDEYGVQK